MLRKGLVRVSHAQLRGADCAAQLVDAFREGGLVRILLSWRAAASERRRGRAPCTRRALERAIGRRRGQSSCLVAIRSIDLSLLLPQGAIAVTDVPGFPEQRRRLLRMGHRLAHQPEAVLQKLEHPASLYNAGWSKGREKIGNMPDEFKGSFYANPIRDRVGLFADTHPFFYPDNIWPKEVRETCASI